MRADEPVIGMLIVQEPQQECTLPSPYPGIESRDGSETP